MLTKTAINMRLAKIQASIYDLEDFAFKTTDDINKLVNEISELISLKDESDKKIEKLSHNLYCGYKGKKK